MGSSSIQDKAKEIAFFDAHAAQQDYDVFTPDSNRRLVATIVRLLGMPKGARVIDLGCGSGVFTHMLHEAGYSAAGIDISPRLIAVGRQRYPGLELLEGDAEHLPFAASSVDGVLLSGLIHHFPDPSRLVAEVRRILKPGGRFVAFDPNRMNPFMYLYRDRSSPFYSPIGVTENERPVLAREVVAMFRAEKFRVQTEYLAGLSYRYVASRRARLVLPIYNAIDNLLFRMPFMAPMRAFLLTSGEKLDDDSSVA